MYRRLIGVRHYCIKIYKINKYRVILRVDNHGTQLTINRRYGAAQNDPFQSTDSVKIRNKCISVNPVRKILSLL